MAIEERFQEEHNSGSGFRRRNRLEVLVDRAEDLWYDEGTDEAYEAWQKAKAELEDLRVRQEAKDRATFEFQHRDVPPAKPDQGMTERIQAAYRGQDPEVKDLLDAVTRAARSAWAKRSNRGTVMDQDDFVQEALILGISRLHQDARSKRPLPSAGALCASVLEELRHWQRADKWAQEARGTTEGPNPEPGDAYTAAELRWALDDLHNRENWHDPAILMAIERIQNPRYREALMLYFDGPKPKGVPSQVMSRAREALLYEVNLEGWKEAPVEGPGTRQVITNHASYWRIEGECGFGVENWHQR